jgi:hypothetical protein
MSYKPEERLAALKGGNGIGAMVLLIVGLIWRAIDAAGNVDFVVQKIPATARIVKTVPAIELLILAAAVLWMAAVLAWPADLGPHGAKVRKMKALLSDAERFHSKYGQIVKKFSDDSVHEAAWRMSKIHTFLDMAFTTGLQQELAKFQDREHQKHQAAGATFDPDRTIAKYLLMLRSRVKASDLDPSFHMPDTYEQFYKTDNWVPNAVE